MGRNATLWRRHHGLADSVPPGLTYRGEAVTWSGIDREIVLLSYRSSNMQGCCVFWLLRWRKVSCHKSRAFDSFATPCEFKSAGAADACSIFLTSAVRCTVSDYCLAFWLKNNVVRPVLTPPGALNLTCMSPTATYKHRLQKCAARNVGAGFSTNCLYRADEINPCICWVEACLAHSPLCVKTR